MKNSLIAGTLILTAAAAAAILISAGGHAREAGSLSSPGIPAKVEEADSFQEYQDYWVDESGFVKEEYLEDYYAYIARIKERDESKWDSLTGGQQETAPAPEPGVNPEETLSAERQEKLDEIRSRDMYGYFVYPREEAEARGETADGFQRPSIEEIRTLILEGEWTCGREIYDALREVFPYADSASGPYVNGCPTEYYHTSDTWTITVWMDTRRELFSFRISGPELLSNKEHFFKELYTDFTIENGVIPAPEETWEDFIEYAEEIPVLDLRKK